MSPAPKSDGSGGRREQSLRETIRELAPYMTLGIQLAAAVVVFFLIGWWLDTRYGTSPTFRLIGLLIGSVGGMIKFLKSAIELGNKEKTP
jgi:F0F1-type ATP synthase assembly protein I